MHYFQASLNHWSAKDKYGRASFSRVEISVNLLCGLCWATGEQNISFG